jgi:PAS domain S-box-containing protein
MSLDFFAAPITPALAATTTAYLRRLVLQRMDCLQPLTPPTDTACTTVAHSPIGLLRRPFHLALTEAADYQQLEELVSRHDLCLRTKGWKSPELLDLEKQIFQYLGYGFNGQECALGYRVLIVDDRPDTIQLLPVMLRKHGYEVIICTSSSTALDKTKEFHPDLIILDVMMPVLDGYEVCQQVKQDPETTNIPIIFISAIQNVVDKTRAFRIGAADYMTKPLQYEEVVARIENQIQIKALQDHLERQNQRFLPEVHKTHQGSELLALIESALSHQKDYVFITEEDGQIIYASPSTSEYLGYSNLELRRLKFYQLHAPLPPPQLFLMRQTLHQPSILRLFKVNHLTKQGHWLSVQLKIFSFRCDRKIYSCIIARCLQPHISPLCSDICGID